MQEKNNIEKDVQQEKLEDLFSLKNKLKIVIEKELNEANKGEALLFLINPEQYSIARALFLELMSKNNLIYITLNKPADFLINSAEKEKISLQKTHFIDMISAINLEKENTEKISFLNSPNSLSESLIELDKVLEKKFADFIAFDSISTLLVYNEKNSVEKFLHTLASKINQRNSIGILLFVESEEYREPIQTIEQFCDKVIKLI
jgi:archaellum biogenesis ATPase FlaH